ncbi:hypothetical protein ACIBO2_32600 [Nonomuraea sp. NPDC050022]|uniref:hypothetical protein n=1 Tax=unclassified Nonomuraea TaxID=2593643 RepID=UPI0033C4AF81
MSRIVSSIGRGRQPRTSRAFALDAWRATPRSGTTVAKRGLTSAPRRIAQSDAVRVGTRRAAGPSRTRGRFAISGSDITPAAARNRPAVVGGEVGHREGDLRAGPQHLPHGRFPLLEAHVVPGLLLSGLPDGWRFVTPRYDMDGLRYGGWAGR